MKGRMDLLVTMLIAFLLLSLFSPAVHARETFVVSDYSNPEWETYVRDMIDEYNVVLPATAPQLVYERKEVKECLGTERPDGFPKPTGIILCHNSLASHPAMLYGLMQAFIFLPTDTRTRPEDFLCHEFMHAVTNIKDKPVGTPLRDNSCVWGLSPHLGAFDISYINETFAAPQQKEKHKKKRHHGRNHR